MTLVVPITAGQVRIYEYSSGTWRKLGNDINGESSDDRFGYAVAMNDLGDRIVVGAYFDDGNGSNSGQVRVYEISGSLWEQLGFDLDGEAANDYSGISVAMNAVGDRVASGGTGNDGGGSNSGHVRVYETPVICPLPLAIVLQQQEDPTFTYSSSSYCSIEADPTPTITGTSGGTFTSTSGLVINSSTGVIDLDASTPGVYDVTYTTSGGTIGSCAGIMTQNIYVSSTITDFNYTATTFCINDTNPKATITGVLNGKFSSSTGLVIDSLTGTINLLASTPGNYNVSYTPPSNFNQLGADLDGKSAGDEFGNEVAFNKVGDIMAVGARYDDPNGSNSGEVFVYQWDGTAWVQYGNSIAGESTNEQSGWDVALNAAGDRLIVGARLNGENGSNSGQVRIYSFDNGVWSQLGQDISGAFANDQFGFSVNINAVGNRIVVGALYNDVNGSNSGQATIYELVNGLWVQLGAIIRWCICRTINLEIQ